MFCAFTVPKPADEMQDVHLLCHTRVSVVHNQIRIGMLSRNFIHTAARFYI